MSDFLLYPLLFVGALLAGWIDSIAGGGGLITIPLLLGIGLPPKLALGTNKFQASFGSFTAAYYYIRKGVVSLQDAWSGIFFTLIGAALGTIAVQQIEGSLLGNIIPFLLLAIAIYTLFRPSLGENDVRAKMPKLLFCILFGLSLGFYDGFFGPGVGSFWAIAYVLALGYGLRKATGYTKVMNFTSNIVSFVLFVLAGHVWILAGLIMAAGQIVGARVGSGMVIRRGAKFIRPVFISIVILTTLKLLYNRFA